MAQFIHNLTAPEPPYDCELAPFPVPVVPFALGALEERTKRFIWASVDDWRRGEQLVRELQRAMLEGCLNELLEGQRRIYRLLDAAMFGRVYSVVTEEPLEITPEIPLVPDMTAANPGLVARIALLQKSVDNAYNGTVYTEFSNTVSIRAQLQQIIDKSAENNELDADMIAQIAELLVLLA